MVYIYIIIFIKVNSIILNRSNSLPALTIINNIKRVEREESVHPANVPPFWVLRSNTGGVNEFANHTPFVCAYANVS